MRHPSSYPQANPVRQSPPSEPGWALVCLGLVVVILAIGGGVL